MTRFNTENPILNDLPMPIVTERLLLREPRFGDGTALHEAKIETWDMLNRWMPWAKEKSTIEDDELVMREAHIKFLQRTDLMMLAFERESGRLVGGTGLHRFNWETRIIEIGYWYRQSAQGKGYATEGTKALIRYAFDVLRANKVVIDIEKGNSNSQRVIEKCGLRHEYTAKKDILTNAGIMADHEFYTCFNADHLRDFHVTWGAE